MEEEGWWDKNRAKKCHVLFEWPLSSLSRMAQIMQSLNQQTIGSVTNEVNWTQQLI